MLTLYGVPVSQPFRAVSWTMLLLRVPFEVQVAVPFLDKEMGTAHDNFLSLTPHREKLIPILRYCPPQGEPQVIAESASIMMHLCERYASPQVPGAPALYPPPRTLAKATIDSYLHWHHTHTRLLVKLFTPRTQPHLASDPTPQEEEQLAAILSQLNSGWLQEDRPYIGGLEQPSIADLLAYSEVCTLTYTNLLSLEKLDRLKAWMDRMKELPFHDDVHKCVMMLGSLAKDDFDAGDTKELRKRLKYATVGGLKSISKAQADFSPISEWDNLVRSSL